MTIISWNCNMAFRKKTDAISKYKPDILVIQECERPERMLLDERDFKPRDVLWIGDNNNKGVGIFSFSNFRFKVHKSHNPFLKTILPVKVIGENISFMLYAIWANNPSDKDGQYITQVWKALDHYKKTIRKKSTLLIGDFNSNTIWDRAKRKGNHSTVVKTLEKKGIHSVYHHYFGEDQGKESRPTFYLYKDVRKPYHIDYCFASGDLLAKLSSVDIGEHSNWYKLSDHVPIVLSFKN